MRFNLCLHIHRIDWSKYLKHWAKFSRLRMAVLFTPAHAANLTTVKCLLQNFATMSGLWVKLQKSEFLMIALLLRWVWTFYTTIIYLGNHSTNTPWHYLPTTTSTNQHQSVFLRTQLLHRVLLPRKRSLHITLVWCLARQWPSQRCHPRRVSPTAQLVTTSNALRPAILS